MTPAPRAISHFGLAAMEVRAARSRRTIEPAVQRGPLVHSRPRPRRFVLRLWLPMTLIFLLLAPFAILLIPFCYLAPPLRRMNCAAAVFTLGAALLAMGGTDVDIDTPDALVRIKIL
jgi:hypothetical protein